MIWYRTFDYGRRIERFEVIKETEKTITYIDEEGNEQKSFKISEYYSWFKNKEDAINCHLVDINNKIMGYEAKINFLKLEKKSILEGKYDKL